MQYRSPDSVFPVAMIVHNPTDCCPEDTGLQPGMTSYSVDVGAETPFGTDGKGVGFGAIADGLFNTAMLVERKTPVSWMRPDQEITFETAGKGINKEAKRIGSRHTGGANIGLYDGSVHFFSDTIDLRVFKGIFTKAGGETASIWD